jgi:hypothetical protein
LGRWARFSATNTERPRSESVRNSGNDPSTMIYLVCVPLLAAQRIARHDDSHCSLLNDRRPWEASSAVPDYGSPFLRREQWHTMSTTFSPMMRHHFHTHAVVAARRASVCS